MTVMEIIELIALVATTVGLIVTLVTAITKGKLKDFIIEKMEEAEKLDMSGEQKLEFVINEVKSKYKIMAIIINIKSFVEKILTVTKEINYKGK